MAGTDCGGQNLQGGERDASGVDDEDEVEFAAEEPPFLVETILAWLQTWCKTRVESSSGFRELFRSTLMTSWILLTSSKTSEPKM